MKDKTQNALKSRLSTATSVYPRALECNWKQRVTRL